LRLKTTLVLVITIIFLISESSAINVSDEILSKKYNSDFYHILKSSQRITHNLEIINYNTGGDISRNSVLIKQIPQTILSKRIFAAAKKGTPLITFGNGDFPRVIIVAGIHGNELPPQIAAMRLINNLNQNKVKGTIYIIPFAIPSSTAKKTRFYKGYDPNREANIKGSPTNIIFQIASMKHVEYLVDFHSNLSERLVMYSKNLNHNIIISELIRKNTRPNTILQETSNDPGKLRLVCNKAGIPAVTCEVSSPFNSVKPGSVGDSYQQMEAVLEINSFGNN
jgi:uncharacterized protein